MTIRHIPFQVDSFEVANGRLAIVSDAFLTLYPARWTPDQLATIAQLLEENFEVIAHVEVADDGTVGIASIEAGEFMPRFNAVGGDC